MLFHKQWTLWLLGFLFISLCIAFWRSYSIHTVVDNKDFTVLNTELPVLNPPTETSLPHSVSSMIGDYIWHHEQQELWLCGSLSATPDTGIFKLIQGQGKHQHVLQQGRYQLLAIQGKTGELWLMNEDGDVTQYQWQALPMNDGRRSMALDNQRYVARTLTSLESTCPMPTQTFARLAL